MPASAAIVGEGNGAVSHHVAHLRERFALQSLAASTCHVHAALAHGRGARLDVLDAERVVDDRRGVRHAADRRKAALGSRAGAGGNVFLLLLAGLAQVDMHVDQTRGDDLARQVALDALLDGKPLPHFDNLAIADHDVGHFVQADLRVDNARVLKQQSHLRSLQAAGTGRPYGSGCPHRPGQG